MHRGRMIEAIRPILLYPDFLYADFTATSLLTWSAP
jgi:hypothetical protein